MLPVHLYVPHTPVLPCSGQGSESQEWPLSQFTSSYIHHNQSLDLVNSWVFPALQPYWEQQATTLSGQRVLVGEGSFPGGCVVFVRWSYSKCCYFLGQEAIVIIQIYGRISRTWVTRQIIGHISSYKLQKYPRLFPSYF